MELFSSQDGGQFDSTNSCIAMFPPIAEMICIKIFEISILVSLNKDRLEYNEPTAATRLLKHELKSLEKARKVHEGSLPGEAMYRFICCVNS